MLNLFSKLPFELRWKIWKFAIPESRVVSITYDKDQDQYFSFNSIIPAILQVCSESRKVGLETYTVCFGTKAYPPSIPFDMRRDILLFDDWLAHSERYWRPYGRINSEAVTPGPMAPAEQNNIRHIAINYMRFYWGKYHGYYSFSDILESALEALVTRLPALEYVYIVVEQVNPYFRERVQFVEIQKGRSCVQSRLRYSGCFSCLGALEIERLIEKLHAKQHKLSWKIPSLTVVGAYRGWGVGREVCCRDDDYRDELKGNNTLSDDDEKSEMAEEVLVDEDMTISAEELQDLLADSNHWLCEQEHTM